MLNFLKGNVIFLSSLVLIFIVIYLVSKSTSNLRIIYLLNTEKRIVTEYIKDKMLELNIGPKHIPGKPHRIPFVIYRTWKNNNLNEQFKHAWETTDKNNPEFKQILYTDVDVNNFINEFKYPGLKEAYNRINPRFGAARADLFRYAILFRYGGFYMDIKSYPNCSIKDKLGNNDSFLLSKWQGMKYRGDADVFGTEGHIFAEKGGEWEQYWLACESNHPIMKAILDKCITNINYPNTNRLLTSLRSGIYSPHEIFITTGPIMMTIVIDEFITYNPQFDDFTITRPGFYGCILYSGDSNFDFKRGHHGAYNNINEKHYSRVNEPLLLSY
tara:strand:- start:24158 stop:25141 length:984 start_codon:yes stop_codon:yes gene_type:complete